MTVQVIGKSLGLGFVGKISRNPFNKISARIAKSILNGSNVETLPSIPFGSAMVINSDNTYSLFGATGTGVASATIANFAGIAVAEVKQSFSYSLGANASLGAYVPSTACDALQQGTTTVYCTEGTPTANGLVYLVTVAGTTAKVGDFVATATPAGSGTAVQLTNARWVTGKIDTTKVCEITLLSQLNA